MIRDCYFCRKPLEVQRRAEIFCGTRCQQLYNQMQQKTIRSQVNPLEGESPRLKTGTGKPSPILSKR